MKVLFVPVADRPECAVALSTAFTLGRSLGASVIGCHIRPHRYSPVVLPSTLEMSGLTNDDAAWRAARKPGPVKKAETAARDLFSKVAESHGYDLLRRPGTKPRAVWLEKTGSPEKVIGIMGPVTDLLVVSRPTSKGGTLARLFLSAALLKSSRPVLVLPQKKMRKIGKHICIAWNQSVEAARAVAAAMPLLVQADRVSIITSGNGSQAGPKSTHLAAYLKYWGIESERVLTDGNDEPMEIVATVKSTGSDLLVMGAYSHSRMRQLMLGGVTEFMLKRASIPILMLHT